MLTGYRNSRSPIIQRLLYLNSVSNYALLESEELFSWIPPIAGTCNILMLKCQLQLILLRLITSNLTDFLHTILRTLNKFFHSLPVMSNLKMSSTSIMILLQTPAFFHCNILVEQTTTF